jgi:glycosyltransferase involved in cell wall biosynthesis
MKERIIWCGASLNFKGLQRYKGEPPSASQWIKGFLKGIEDNAVEVEAYAPIWDSYFPKGKLFPGLHKFLDSSLNQTIVRYLNFPFLRKYSVAKALSSKIKNSIRKKGKPLAILNYNTYPHYCQALQSVVAKYPDVLWINVVLDLDDPDVDDWSKFRKDTKGSQGAIFLSWWGFQNSPLKYNLHMDCGWSGNLPIYEIPEKKIFIYAGKMADYGGINVLVDVIKKIDNPEIIFKFYGKGSNSKLIELAENDTRVKLGGFVTDEELNKVCEKAFAFLSPRDNSHQGTKMIFPSKILFYLKYQKPVISSMLLGMSPDYKNVLIEPIDDSVVAWKKQIEIVSKYKSRDMLEIKQKTSTLLAMKTWQNQGNNVINLIKKIKEDSFQKNI